MEAVKTVAENLQRGEQTKTLSTPQSTGTKTTIPRDEHAAIFSIINKARLLNGWTMRTAQELDPTIRVWHEALRFYEIPAAAYPELYKRALDVRQKKMQMNENVPLIDAALLISQWTGNYGLKAELRQREIDRGRTLGANAESICQHCFGSGWRDTGDGRHARCEHA